MTPAEGITRVRRCRSRKWMERTGGGTCSVGASSCCLGAEGRFPRSRFSPWPIWATAWMSRRRIYLPCPMPLARQVRRSRRPMPSISGVDVTLADVYTLPSAGPHWKGRIAGGLPLLLGDDRLRGRPESAEWIGDRGVDFRDGRLMGRVAPSLRAVPKLSCGAGLRREPIYVIDPQGRIIRTLGD